MNKEEAIEFIKNGGDISSPQLKDFRNDKEVVLKSVSGFRGYTLSYACEELKNDKEVVMAAVKHNPQAIRFASEEILHDKDFILGLVKKDHLVYENIPVELKKDISIAFHACQTELCSGYYDQENPNFVDTYCAAPKEIRDIIGNNVSDITNIENAHRKCLEKVVGEINERLNPSRQSKIVTIDDIYKPKI